MSVALAALSPRELGQLFVPNRDVATHALTVALMGWILVGFLAWQFGAPVLIPKPMEVFAAFGKLWYGGFFWELMTSMKTIAESIAITALLSLGLVYLGTYGVVRPVIRLVSTGRFLSTAGITFLFTLWATDSHQLKVMILVFVMTVCFVNDMAKQIANIPEGVYDHAKSLGLGHWGVTREVVILGKRDVAFDVMITNAAIGWMMLMTVEGLARSQGGVGALLLNQNKQMHLDEVFAIQLFVFAAGILLDWGLGVIKNLVCPYALVGKARRS